MRQIDVRAWEDFESQLRSIEESHGSGATGRGHVSALLFRGQADGEWPLATTLERSEFGNVSLQKYYRLIAAVKPQIEAATGKAWDVPDPQRYDEWLSKQQHTAVTPPGYKYMVYLRHHGFPSPLLDWTRSPYVAAFFAFRHARSSTKRVAIFVYREYLGHGKGWTSQEPHIHGLGSDIRTHQRHVLQQSEYTICTVRDSEWRYARHQDAFRRGQPDHDVLLQLLLPSTDCLKALQSLDNADINAYSLFGTEDALVETIALRESFRIMVGP
jgi:FRG domain